jgi:hypothetical protein
MIIFPGRHIMGVLECHQLIPPNKMVEFKTYELCVKRRIIHPVKPYMYSLSLENEPTSSNSHLTRNKK